MPSKLRFCILCKRHDRTKRSLYTRIWTVEREAKVQEGYRRRNNGQQLDQSVLYQLVHRKCYARIARGISSVHIFNQIKTTNNENLFNMEENISFEQDDDDDDDDQQDQTSLTKFRSSMPLPSNISKKEFERRQRICVICHQHAYESYNKIKQIKSKYSAKEIAQGYFYLHQQEINQSLINANIHELCFRKLHSIYRNHILKKSTNTNRSLQEVDIQSLITPHETRSRSKLNQSSSLSEIEQLLTTSLYTSVTTIKPNIELSARSDLFRPYIQQLTTEEINFYTKRNSLSNLIIEQTEEEQLPHTSATNDSMIDSNNDKQEENDDDDDDDMDIIEQDTSPDWMPGYIPPPRLMFNRQQKIFTAAKIRRRYLKPPSLIKPTVPVTFDQPYFNNNQFQPSNDLQNFYIWLIEQLKSFKIPLSMKDIQIKYKELTNNININNKQIQIDLEKFYPNQFIFIKSDKQQEPFIALNDINHYLQSIIKTSKNKKTSISSSTVNDKCEIIMNGIRQIRYYLRHQKQTDLIPSILIENFIGLLTTSEKEFDKISRENNYYRMMNDYLFNTNNKTATKKIDKNRRNRSLASDLISARHDQRTSIKHFLLADELHKKEFHFTPKQVITLFNHYGHTCSYQSYIKMKRLQKQLNEKNVN